MSNDTRFHPGDVLDGRMEVIRAIRGGVGEVYLCVDRSNDRPLALKRLQNRYANMPKFSEAFRSEAETWIQLGRHPNIVPCVVLQTMYTEPILVLEWIFGPDGSDPDLGNRMRDGRLDLRTILEIGIDVCSGLIHAASRVPSMVHRDLKPANILIDSQGAARITDFGMAKSALDAKVAPSETASGAATDLNPAAGGTPRYMAPEQWTGGELDARTDVYALGAVLFEALSGHSAYLGPGLEDFRRQHITSPVPRLEVSTLPSEGQRLNALLSRCLAKNKNERTWPSGLQVELSELYQELFGKSPPERAAGAQMTPRDWNNRAVTFHSLGRSEEALAQYCHALELDPSYAFARSNYAATLLSLGRAGEALAELNRAIDDDPNCATAYVNRAGIYEGQQRRTDALADYQHAIDKDPRLTAAYLGRADIYEDSGNLDKALTDLETAAAFDPLNGLAWQRQGEMLRELGRNGEAIQRFNRAIEVRGNSALAYLQRALTYFGMGDDRLAIEDLNAAIELDKELSAAYLLRGHARVHLWESTVDHETLRGAVHDYSRAIELDPNLYPAYVGRGRILSDDYQEEAAIADFTRAVALDPGNPEAYLERALACNDSNRYDQALADLKRVLELDPTSYAALHALGEAQRSLGNFQAAITAYTRAIAVGEGAAEAYAHRAQARLELGKNKKALKDVNYAIELAPKWGRAYRIRAAVYMALGDEQAAAADEAKAMVMGAHFTTMELPGPGEASTPQPAAAEQTPDPDDTLPEMDEAAGSPGQEELRMRADGLFDHGRYAEAVAAYTELIAAGDASARAYNKRGLAKVRSKAVEEGIDDYNRAIQADPNSAAAYNNRGVAYRSLGRTKDAIRDYDRAIELDSNYAMACINRGNAYVALEDTDRGLTDLTRGIDLDPKMAEGYADRGAVYANLKRFDEAIADMQRALEVNPSYAAGHYNLGVLLANRGELDEGLRAIERAASLGMPSADETAKWLRQRIEQRNSKRS